MKINEKTSSKTMTSKSMKVKRVSNSNSGVTKKHSSKLESSKHNNNAKKALSVSKNVGSSSKRSAPTSKKSIGSGQPITREDQKELRRERKRQRLNFDVIEAMQKAWASKHKIKEMKRVDREARVQRTLDAAADKLVVVVLKHDVSRVIQSCIKYGSITQRHNIALALKEELRAIASSQYGSHIAVKLMHYGNKAIRSIVVEQLMGHCRALSLHRDACKVFNFAFRSACSEQQKRTILLEFYGPEFRIFGLGTRENPQPNKNDSCPTLMELIEQRPNKRESIIKHVVEFLEKNIEKGTVSMSVCHRLLHDLLTCSEQDSARISSLIELFREHTLELLQTSDGAHAVCTMLANGTSKDRKLMLKTLKSHTNELIIDPDAYIVLVRAIDVVDDTVLTGKIIIDELTSLKPENLRALLLDSCAQKLFLHIMAPQNSNRAFTVGERELLQPPLVAKSKKDPETRRAQLVKRFVKPLLIAIALPDVLEVNNEDTNLLDCEYDSGVDILLCKRAIGEIIFGTLHAAMDSVDTEINALGRSALVRIAHRVTNAYSTRDIGESAFSHSTGHRFVKRLVSDFGSHSEVSNAILTALETDPNKALNSRGCWIICALFEISPEVCSASIHTRIDKLRVSVSQVLHTIDVEGPGIKMLRSLIK